MKKAKGRENQTQQSRDRFLIKKEWNTYDYPGRS